MGFDTGDDWMFDVERWMLGVFQHIQFSIFTRCRRFNCCAIIAVFLFAFCAESSAEISPTNSPFTGVKLFSEIRTNPPNRLFVAEVDLANPRIQLRVSRGGDDPDGDGRWETTLMRPTSIAERERFDLVVNGDFYEVPRVQDGGISNVTYRVAGWAAVNGMAVSAGKVWSVAEESRPCLVVSKEGKVSIRSIKKPTPQDQEVISGNTMILRGGSIVARDDKVRHPRTVAGLNKDATKLILLVVDGRKPGVAQGMSYVELAQEMLRLGCHDALNLDGGGSSLMAVRDSAGGGMKILNEPTDGRERAVANVLGVSLRSR